MYCAEFRGRLHSKMLTKLKAVPTDEFDAWFRKALKDASIAELSAAVLKIVTDYLKTLM